jgi:hypothetical protein
MLASCLHRFVGSSVRAPFRSAEKPQDEFAKAPIPLPIVRDRVQAKTKEAGMQATKTIEGASCWTDGYVLEHCEEFSVESPVGKLGYVAAVDPTHDELVVIGNQAVMRVSFRRIDFIDALEERIVVDTGRRNPNPHAK